MSAEEPHRAYPGLDGELKNTLFELCMDEVAQGRITMADVPGRMGALARVHSHGAMDVAAVALNPVRPTDQSVPPIQTGVKVDLLEKEK